jgi:hypothetical protein
MAFVGNNEERLDNAGVFVIISLTASMKFKKEL